MNHVLQIAAITQLRLDTEGGVCNQRKRAAGKRPLDAIRCLKRRISDNVYHQLLAAAERVAGSPTQSDGARRRASRAGRPPAA